MYLVWQDSRFGPRSSIAFSQSLDGGLTWSTPIKVNQTPDLANNLNEQAFTPMVHVLDDGTVGVSYYDFRSNTADNGATPPPRRSSPTATPHPRTARWRRAGMRRSR